MEDPEAYLRALTAPLASARKGSSLPVIRFSLEAVANAFVILGLLPAARAGEILAGQRPVLPAAGFRVGLERGELGVSAGARSFREARAASGGTAWIPAGQCLAVPAPGQTGSRDGGPAARWAEFSAGSGPTVRAEIPSPAAVPGGTTQPPWPTPAECYLAQLPPPAAGWSIGSSETGTVELDTAAIVAAAARPLPPPGAPPPHNGRPT